MSMGDRAVVSENQQPIDPTVYLPMVKNLARRLSRKLPSHIELDDLVSAGVVGLMEAVQRFDAQRHVAFRNFAEFRVRGAMLDEIRRRDLMARDARIEIKKIERALEHLNQQLGRQPHDEELADYLGMRVTAFQEKLRKLNPVQIFSLEKESQDFTHVSAFDAAANAQKLGRLTDAVQRLSLKQQQILHLYYQEELTLKQIGEVLEVSESRVSQLMSRINLQLRQWMRT